MRTGKALVDNIIATSPKKVVQVVLDLTDWSDFVSDLKLTTPISEYDYGDVRVSCFEKDYFYITENGK
jgi:hypothetical protein